MYFKQTIGKLGEDLAYKYLKAKKYTIVDRNFRCKQGEIDIIAKDNIRNELVFIEVKTRSNLKYGRPCEAVNLKKEKHINESARYYLYKNEITNMAIRLDIIEVYIKNNTYSINHIKQSF